MTSQRIILTVVCLVVSAVPVAAQVTYDPYGRSNPAYSVPQPELQPDETLGTSPSFEIIPDALGAPRNVRIVERCQYPNGWNVTDFSRDLNGTPADVDHTCVSTRDVHGRRARY